MEHLTEEQQFIARRQPRWAELAELLATAGGSVRGLKRLSPDQLQRLPPLYRRAASDLARAQSRRYSPAVQSRLNRLVGQAYTLLYQADNREWTGIAAFFRSDFPQAFRRRLGPFLVSVCSLLSGYLIAYLLVITDRGRLDIFVPPNHPFRESLAMWTSGKVSSHMSDSASALYASQLMTNNIWVSMLCFALGILGGLPPIWLMFTNGALLGAFTAMVAHSGQLAAFWPGILPHGVVELSEVCLAGAAGISMGWSALAPGQYRRREAVSNAARDSVKLVIGGIALLLFAGLVEGFVSHSMLPAGLKLTIGAASGVLLYAYLFAAGRAGSRDATAASSASHPHTG